MSNSLLSPRRRSRFVPFLLLSSCYIPDHGLRRTLQVPQRQSRIASNLRSHLPPLSLCLYSFVSLQAPFSTSEPFSSATLKPSRSLMLLDTDIQFVQSLKIPLQYRLLPRSLSLKLRIPSSGSDQLFHPILPLLHCRHEQVCWFVDLKLCEGLSIKSLLHRHQYLHESTERSVSLI